MTQKLSPSKIKRKPISPKIRFEVFKRDSFTCQYCGQKAPDVVLETDHILPVSKEGTNDILNLITSCWDCNRGKGARKLDDDTEIKKQQAQLEELNERRLQLEQMLKWREGLRDIGGDELDTASEYWHKAVSPFSLTETGKSDIKKLVKKFGVIYILDAIDVSVDAYLKYNSDGKPTDESVGVCFSKLGGICFRRKFPEKVKNSKDAYYVRGILRNRVYVNESIIMRLLANAEKLNVDMEGVKDLAKICNNWTEFRSSIENFIESRTDV